MEVNTVCECNATITRQMMCEAFNLPHNVCFEVYDDQCHSVNAYWTTSKTSEVTLNKET